MNEADLPDHAEDARHEIAALEQRIERLTEQLYRSRKVAVAAKLAISAGAVVLAAILFGIIYADALPLLTGSILVLGGVVLAGSNATTATQLSEEIEEAQADRAELIDDIAPTLVPGETKLPQLPPTRRSGPPRRA